MDSKEFLPVRDYLSVLKTEQDSPKSTEHDPRRPDGLKNKLYYSLMPLFLKKWPKAQIRDFLDIDGTFAFVLTEYSGISLTDSIGIYLDLKDILEEVTFAKVKNTGFVDLADLSPGFKGFWILLK